MKIIILVTTLLLLCYSLPKHALGIAVIGPLTQTAFKCLAQNQLTASPNRFAIIRVYQISGTPGLDPHANQTLLNINTVTVSGGYSIHAYMQICRGTNATSQVATVVTKISIDLFEAIFIKIEPNTTPGCEWDNYTTVENCNYLTEAIKAVNGMNRGLSGVFSTARIWGDYFGGECDSMAKVAKYLWYADYKSGQLDAKSSFNGFIPFGGWKTPSVKQVGGNVTVKLCGHSDWQAHLDYVWSSIAF